MPFLARARAARLGYPSPGVVADRGLGLAPPLACTPGTPASTAGPFYTPSTPRRASLREPGSGGEPLVLQGLVLTPDCRPVAGAAVDLWHSDERGRYDNSGFAIAAISSPTRPARSGSRPSAPATTPAGRRISTSRCRARGRAR